MGMVTRKSCVVVGASLKGNLPATTVPSRPHPSRKMQKHVLLKCLLFVALLAACSQLATATYRKPPFNGSIFGKRAGSSIDYDGAGKALSSMCEIATEACAAWFPQRDESK